MGIPGDIQEHKRFMREALNMVGRSQRLQTFFAY